MGRTAVNASGIFALSLFASVENARVEGKNLTVTAEVVRLEFGEPYVEVSLKDDGLIGRTGLLIFTLYLKS